jgi:hypothetical protein
MDGLTFSIVELFQKNMYEMKYCQLSLVLQCGALGLIKEL